MVPHRTQGRAAPRRAQAAAALQPRGAARPPRRPRLRLPARVAHPLRASASRGGRQGRQGRVGFARVQSDHRRGGTDAASWAREGCAEPRVFLHPRCFPPLQTCSRVAGATTDRARAHLTASNDHARVAPLVQDADRDVSPFQGALRALCDEGPPEKREEGAVGAAGVQPGRPVPGACGGQDSSHLRPCAQQQGRRLPRGHRLCGERHPS
eukprot:scaffold61798_cov69-Phaeocystis_antarctica.AAC.1